MPSPNPWGQKGDIVADQGRRVHRPILTGNVEALASAMADGEPSARLELAHATACALVDAGRAADGTDPDELVRLAETVGLDTLSALWRDAAADSLPGALWALYLLRTWCQQQGAEVARLYRAGRGLAPVDEVVAGVADGADPAAVAATADAVLSGAYRGDFAVALERAAAFFRIVGVGRLELAADGEQGAQDQAMAERNRRCAEALERAAAAWREGTLH
jgi:hypothetical protein